MANVIVEYRTSLEPVWLRCIAAAGETFEECALGIRRIWPEAETRQYIPKCPHDVSLWSACEPCGRSAETADKLLGFGAK